MRTVLYTRLKPEIKRQIEEQGKLYPATARSVIAILKDKTFYSDLTISEVTDLTMHVNIYDRTDHEWFAGKDLFITENNVV